MWTQFMLRMSENFTATHVAFCEPLNELPFHMSVDKP